MTRKPLEQFLTKTPKSALTGGGFIDQTISNVKKLGTGISEAITKRGGDLREAVTTENIPSGLEGLGSRVLQGAGAGAGALLDVGFEGIKAVARQLGAVTPDFIEDPIKKKAVESAKFILETPVNKLALQKIGEGAEMYKSWKNESLENETLGKNLEAFLNVVSLLPIGAAGKPVVKAGEEIIKDTGNIIGGGIKSTFQKIGSAAEQAGIKVGETVTTGKESLFGRPRQINNIDDVIKEADHSLKPSGVLTATEKATAKPSLVERFAGIRPDIKNRIAGKSEKLKEYFDVAHARNNFDTLPTPLEHGVKNVDNAVAKMEGVLNDTGSEIGKFRNQISTYQAPIDSVKGIEKAFVDQLGKLNLELKKGVVQKIPGTITKVSADSDIKIIQELFQELSTIKEAPNLERLIDFRMLFDNKINFAKSAREASSSLDPFSRAMRTRIAEVGAEIVGKEQAGNLAKYSNAIEAYNNLRSFTDRKAGAEFLLKQVLSERGGTSREIMQTIKEITGIDLMDDAVMASIATDLIGNPAQKGLFRQEISKAGLDTLGALRGDPNKAVELMFNFLRNKVVNREKVFLKAAE